MTSERPRAGAARVVQLGEISLPRLMFALLHQRFSGTLELSQPPPHEGQRTIWLDGGMPVFTDWISPSDVLGQVLSELGVVAEPELVSALESLAQKGGLLGEELLRRGAIEHRKLMEGLRVQTQRKLVGCFALSTGDVAIAATSHDLGRTLPKTNVLALILAGVTRHHPIERIELEMGEALRGPVKATPSLAKYQGHFRFRGDDEPILRHLAQGSRLDQLVKAGLPEDRSARLIYTLWACQMLRVGRSALESSDEHPVPRSAAPDRAPPRASDSPKAPTPAPSSTRSAAPPPPATSRPSTPPASTRSPAPEPSKPSDDDFEARLESFESKVAQGAHAFDLLGVPLSAGKREVRRVWGDLSRQFHPDALGSKGMGHLRERVGKVFAALSEAQMILSDKDQREKLRAKLERGESPEQSGSDATAMARAAFESEVIAKEADRYLRGHRYAQALEEYERAVKLTPDEPDLLAAIVWCRYNVSAKTRDDAAQAQRALGDVVTGTPKLARAHYFRGLVLKDLGMTDAALLSFAEAYRSDPRLIDAERQARALRASQGVPPSGTGDKRSTGRSDKGEAKSKFGLRGLFGKK